MELAVHNPFVVGASTCHPVRLPWASENPFVFRDLREGEGRGGGFLHPSPRYSKLIAFDFAPPSARTHQLSPPRSGVELHHFQQTGLLPASLRSFGMGLFYPTEYRS